MIETILRHVLPASYSFLPAKMNTPEASAMLLACGLQETRFIDRKQKGGGPGRGFWQFEPGPMSALAGVLTHKQTKEYAAKVLERSMYALPVITDRALKELCEVLAHNDIVAASFARLLLWTLPAPLPKQDQADRAWEQYFDAWRPGDPHPETWRALYGEAWDRVLLDHAREDVHVGSGAGSLPGGLPDTRNRGRRATGRRPSAHLQAHRFGTH